MQNHEQQGTPVQNTHDVNKNVELIKNDEAKHISLRRQPQIVSHVKQNKGSGWELQVSTVHKTCESTVLISSSVPHKAMRLRPDVQAWYRPVLLTECLTDYLAQKAINTYK